MAAMQAEAGVPDVAGGVGAPTVIPGPAFDVAVLRESVGDDAAILREVVACFDEVASAIRAELLAVAAAWQDDVPAACAETARLAHKLKSSAASVGALPLAALCAKLEASGVSRDAERAHGLLAAAPGVLDQALLAMRGWSAPGAAAAAAAGRPDLP